MGRRRRWVAAALVASLFLQSACIHTSSKETASIQLLELNKLDGSAAQKDHLRIEHLVYSPAKLPLEDFFGRLMKGEFETAFQRIDLSYKPATSDDKVLQELLSVGLIPVYVRMNNQDAKAHAFDESDFTLDDGKHRLQAIPASQLPKVLKRFHIGAFSANVYNTGVVVLTVAAYMAVMVLATHAGSIPAGARSSSGDSENRVYNDTTKETHLNYKNYLLTERSIPPGEAVQGLLFFRVNKDFDTGHMRFGFKNLSQEVKAQ